MKEEGLAILGRLFCNLRPCIWYKVLSECSEMIPFVMELGKNVVIYYRYYVRQGYYSREK